nr:hypothetical protein [Desulfuromonas acetoxidans]
MFEFSPQDLFAIAMSARVATVATLLTLPIGFALAWVLVFSRIPGKGFIDGSGQPATGVAAGRCRLSAVVVAGPQRLAG